MEQITEIRFGPLPADSPYVKPFRMHYVQNGKEKNWDLLKVHDSVSIIILNKTRNNLVFVKQFRPGEFRSGFYEVKSPLNLFKSIIFVLSRISFYNHIGSREFNSVQNWFGEISGQFGHYIGTVCRHCG